MKELSRAGGVISPAVAFDRALGCISSGDVFVEFSGGLDSSLLLAAATLQRRAYGLPDPLPVTRRHAGQPDTEESEFQEAVIDHLGIREWQILDADENLDVLGPAAQLELSENGPALFARLPARRWFLDRMGSSGVVLSGEGGDEVFGRAPLAAFYLARYAAISRTNRRVAVRSLASFHKSTSLARRRQIGRSTPTWLTEAAGKDYRRHLIRTTGPGWSVASNHRDVRSRRDIVMLIDSLEKQARRHGLEYRAPILDLQFVSTLHLLIPSFDFFDRAFLIRKYFPGYLPEKLLRRTTKAHFASAMFGPMAIDFAEKWDGTGLPDDLVIAPELREAWRRKEDGRSCSPMQWAWMYREGLL